VFTTPDVITAALFCVLMVLLAVIGARAWRRSRVSPVERERRRRLWLVSHGKMGDSNLLEIHEGILVYSYDVRGVEYTASQDVSTLNAFLPDDVASLGHVLVRYDPRNPANSIVLSEEWNGLQSASPANLGAASPLSPGK
jgi:hypothetical protein